MDGVEARKTLFESIVKYSYYDETGKRISILDEEKIKQILKTDEVKFKEEY